MIRFAEQQIFQFPELCIQMINDVRSAALSLNLQEIYAPKKFEVKKWTKEDAHSLAYKRFRHSYIPQVYHPRIHVENYKFEANKKMGDKYDLPF